MALNILQFAPQNVSDLVLLVAAAVWIPTLLILLFDIKNQKKPIVWRVCWASIVFIPAIGGGLYSLSELLQADWRSALSLRPHDSNKHVTNPVKIKQESVTQNTLFKVE